MRFEIPPQRIVVNPVYPYEEQVLRARRHLEQLGIAHVKPVYASAPNAAGDDDAGAARAARN